MGLPHPGSPCSPLLSFPFPMVGGLPGVAGPGVQGQCHPCGSTHLVISCGIGAGGHQAYGPAPLCPVWHQAYYYTPLKTRQGQPRCHCPPWGSISFRPGHSLLPLQEEKATHTHSPARQALFSCPLLGLSMHQDCPGLRNRLLVQAWAGEGCLCLLVQLDIQCALVQRPGSSL